MLALLLVQMGSVLPDRALAHGEVMSLVCRSGHSRGLLGELVFVSVVPFECLLADVDELVFARPLSLVFLTDFTDGKVRCLKSVHDG
jgi:hypothetical protein